MCEPLHMPNDHTSVCGPVVAHVVGTGMTDLDGPRMRGLKEEIELMIVTTERSVGNRKVPTDKMSGTETKVRRRNKYAVTIGKLHSGMSVIVVVIIGAEGSLITTLEVVTLNRHDHHRDGGSAAVLGGPFGEDVDAPVEDRPSCCK